METQFCKDRYGGEIFRPLVIPRHSNSSIDTANFKLQCEGRIGTKALEDEMYMSEIVERSHDISVPWYTFPLDECPTLTVHWEYGTCYPLSRYFDVKPPCGEEGYKEAAKGSRNNSSRSRRKLNKRRAAPPADDNDDDNENETNDNISEFDPAYDEFLDQLSAYEHAVLYLNPVRHSMMLFVVSPRFGDDWPGSMQRVSGKTADGGLDWSPRIELAHEFSLIPALKSVSFSGDQENILRVVPMMHGLRVHKGMFGGTQVNESVIIFFVILVPN